MDQFESEIESLMATQKKKKMDKDKSDRIEDLKEFIDRHQYHIKKLEILMRMLDNQSIDCDQVTDSFVKVFSKSLAKVGDMTQYTFIVYSIYVFCS